MTDHKFTDDELQRCIECCIKGKVWGDCKKLNCPAIRKQGCHFYLRTDDDYENTIYIEILKDALALINRQKASLQEVITLNSKLEAENAKLQRLLDFYEETSGNKKAKTEAIKEFAERLKQIDAEEEFACYDKWGLTYVDDEKYRNAIDNLVKEMTEGGE